MTTRYTDSFGFIDILLLDCIDTIYTITDVDMMADKFINQSINDALRVGIIICKSSSAVLNKIEKMADIAIILMVNPPSFLNALNNKKDNNEYSRK